MRDVTLRERIADPRPLLGDGANGTLLSSYGVSESPPDLACLSRPDLVERAHREYLNAGADFIETNTFAASPSRLPEGVDVAALNRAAATLAKKVALEYDPPRYVLGAIGPAARRLEPLGPTTVAQAQADFRAQAEALIEGGVDGFFLETFDDVAELKLATETIRALTDLPIIVSKAYIEDGGMIQSGLPIRVAEELNSLPVDAVGANCVVGPQRMLDLVRMIAESSDLPVVAFPTPGLPQLVKGKTVYDRHPEYFARGVARLVKEGGARIVGGCCGTTPEHIRELRKALDGLTHSAAKRQGVTRVAKKEEVLPDVAPSPLLAALQAGRFVKTVELDVPRGLKLEKFLQHARNLKDAGADVINVSDGARARLRMNPMAVTHLVQREAGIEAVMHFACRDRNLLAIQADLLAVHALGIRNVLAVTGDPANIGDYPSATSVFDIDAVGLVRILSRFNEGKDLAGYSLREKAGFTIACAFNPLAPEPEAEMERLRRKADAGAHLIYTQPCFAESQVDLCVAAARTVGLPVLVGLLPLRNPRHAEFMAYEVPGIEVPEDLLQRIVNAPDDASAEAIGMEEAVRVARRIHSVAHGLYIMPPAGRDDIAADLLTVS